MNIILKKYVVFQFRNSKGTVCISSSELKERLDVPS